MAEPSGGVLVRAARPLHQPGFGYKAARPPPSQFNFNTLRLGDRRTRRRVCHYARPSPRRWASPSAARAWVTRRTRQRGVGVGGRGRALAPNDLGSQKSS